MNSLINAQANNGSDQVNFTMSEQSRLFGYESDKKSFASQQPKPTAKEYEAHIKLLVEKWGI